MIDNDLQTTLVDRQKGFALIAVIWIAVLLSLIAAAFSSSVRSRLRSVASHADLVRSEAAADAGVRIALLDLLNRENGTSKPPRFPDDGTPVMCAIGDDASLIIQVEDEEGKVNLNGINEDVLTALFSGLGAGQSKARAYAQRVMDFRDSDDDRRADGAERSDYSKKSAGSSGPKNADFVSADELDQVLDLPADIREKAKPWVTALSGIAGLDVTVSPRGLKDALVRGTNGIVAPSSNGQAAISISSELPPSFLSRSTHRSYTVRAEAVLTSGARYVSDAIVGLPAGAVGSPIFQRWRRGTSRIPPGQAIPVPSALKPC
jgi:general secretion pathway protein K